jgi:hypothetical protein
MRKVIAQAFLTTVAAAVAKVLVDELAAALRKKRKTED